MSKERRARRAIAELGIVVLGVMIALFADSLREGVASARVEAQYVVRLRGDLSDGLDKLTKLRAEFAVVAESARALAESQDADTRPLPDDELIAALLAAAQMGFDPEQLGSDVTYRELVASGQLALLSSPATRQGLVAYYRESERLANGLESLPPINERVGELTGYLPTEFLNEGRALSVADRQRLIQELWSEPGISKELRLLNAELTFYDRVFAQVIAQGQQLIADLD